MSFTGFSGSGENPVNDDYTGMQWIYMKLTKKVIANVSLMADKFGVDAAANVALVLAGMRPGYRCDTGPVWFKEDGDWNDESHRSRVAEAFIRNYSDFVNFVRDKFEGVLEAVDQFEPLVYRVGTVSGSDLKAIGRKNDSTKSALKAYARALNFTGTAFPCNRDKDTVVVTWLSVDGKGRMSELSTHCAKPAEVYKCVREFAAMKKRAKDVLGVDFGSFVIADLKMSFNRETDVVVS